MVKYLVILKGENKKLREYEFEILWMTYFNENVLLSNIENTLYSFETNQDIEQNNPFLDRLTFTNFITKVLFEAKDFNDYEKKILQMKDMLEHYNNKKFLVRIKKSKKNLKVDYIEKELAKPIWNMLLKPNVSVDNPDIEFNFVFKEESGGFYVCKKIFENDKDYLRRMPKLRPIKMPYTLKSDMARCAINLLGLRKGLILDPFCGIGGILLEGYDMGFDVVGNDISWNDLKYFKENFDFFYPNSSYLRTLADSKTQFLKENTIDGIVTDIPYGKSSRLKGTDLYEDFLKSARNYLKPRKKLIVIYAHFVEFKELALKYFSEVCEIEEYINKSMTRYILVLENSREF